MSDEGWEPMMRRLVDAELRHYGYTEAQLALANLDRPHTDGCEFDANHQGWVCTDENGKSFHPEWDEATDVSGVVGRALEALHYDEEETKALAETATRLGYELGRKEAGEEIAQAIEAQVGDGEWAGDYYRKAAQIARETTSQPSGAASTGRTDPGGYIDLPEDPRGLSNRNPEGLPGDGE